MTILEISGVVYCQVFLNYLKCPDIYDQVILYEDLIEDPHAELGKLFDILKIDHKHIPLAITALERDSQNGFFGERAKCRSHTFSDRDLQDINRILSMASLEMLHDIAWEDFKKIFEGKTVLWGMPKSLGKSDCVFGEMSQWDIIEAYFLKETNSLKLIL